MPCTLPLPELAGVFMSPCASTQMRPSGLSSRRTKSAVAATDPAARLWSPPSTSGKPPSLEHAERRLVELLADARDLADVLLLRIAERLDLRNRRDEVAFVDDGHAERGEPLGEAGDAKRRWSHVDAAAVAAEVERDADEVESLRAHRR